MSLCKKYEEFGPGRKVWARKHEETLAPRRNMADDDDNAPSNTGFKGFWYFFIILIEI